MPILIRLGMKYLSSDNAFVRAFGSLNCDAQASFYSLFRWAKTEEPFSRLLPCSGCDEIVLFEIQIREKTCYCDDVIFFRRMVRIGCESADRTKYMQRMVGNDFDAAKLHQSIEAFFSEMYRIVDSLGKPKTWLGRWYYLRTKFRLFRKHSEAKCFLVFNHYPLTTRLWGFLRGCKQGLRRFLSRFSRN